MKHTYFIFLLVLGQVFFSIALRSQEHSELGVFEGQTDVGTVGKPGSARFEPERKAYQVTGGGDNMWFSTDALHFVWKKVSGDLSLAADIEWPQAGGNAHRKACLLIRQTLDADSAYADAVVHGDGLCSLQYREAPGAPTREIQSNVSGPSRIRIEKQGEFVALSVAKAGQPLGPAGGSFKLPFREPFYVGLGVCSHDNRVSETAVFSDVVLTTGTASATNGLMESTLETVAIASKDRRVVYHSRTHFEAPNWSRDGKYFIYNSKGRIYRIPREGGEPQLIESGSAARCNNDHGLAPDGTLLAISHHGGPNGQSLIYLLPISGGIPVQLTWLGPSYWHGWSPDGATLAYCGERNGNFDIYTIPLAGGAETRLTTAKGLDDGPDYSPDGKFIYFNSDRTGLMQVWRMKPDGTEQEQITSDDLNNWFPHPSPDGKWIVFLSYPKEVEGHPANKDVELRLRPVSGGAVQVLAKLFGGQGTLNVPSWSPDSKHVAFVSYRMVW